jgi:hypothetical protein
MKMSKEEIEQAWESIRWANRYIAEWKLYCLIWFALGFATCVLLTLMVI